MLRFLSCAQLFGKNEPFSFPSPCGQRGESENESPIISLFSNSTINIFVLFSIIATFFSAASSALRASTSSASRRTFPTVCSLTWIDFWFVMVCHDFNCFLLFYCKIFAWKSHIFVSFVRSFTMCHAKSDVEGNPLWKFSFITVSVSRRQILLFYQIFEDKLLI